MKRQRHAFKLTNSYSWEFNTYMIINTSQSTISQNIVNNYNCNIVSFKSTNICNIPQMNHIWINAPTQQFWINQSLLDRSQTCNICCIECLEGENMVRWLAFGIMRVHFKHWLKFQHFLIKSYPSNIHFPMFALKSMGNPKCGHG